MLWATFLPSATYNAGSLTFTVTHINTALTAAGLNNITASDSVEVIMTALLQLMWAKCQSGAITEYNCGVQISNSQLSVGSVETAANTYSDRLLLSMLYVADCGSSTTPLNIDVDTVQTKT